ncbi:hypothetical protein PaecuDRAFT_0965 [Paenibacillus curdlanolyticus YK9]|uniref:Uncharacterized protein n=1 Tax=Paenibacillus curdlanolyticus YK9 TaxID=717606 RepID=E0I5P3_9BACL|nr:hypothetical protein [Paenibacillus curdlanolyticus]EFM12285.1 hypothetical protein PaecuDRAFT_0965 [Paenibacillus curdlanolyticus YK9]
MANNVIPTMLKQRYYANQLLNVEDFNRERDFHIAGRELLSRFFVQNGILQGLDVSQGSQNNILISPGAAIDERGSLILLTDRAQLAGNMVLAQSGSVSIDLSEAAYANKIWLLVIQSHDAQVADHALQSCPILTLLDTSSATPDSTQIPLSQITVTSTGTAPDIITITIRLDESVRQASSLQAGRMPELSASQIPALDASKMTSGVLDAARIPVLDVNKMTAGALDVNRIPALDASKIASGVLDAACIPALDANKIASGLLDAAQVPTLDASKIATGTLDIGRLPSIPASQITDLPTSELITYWAANAAIYSNGGAFAASPLAAGERACVIGLLKIVSDQGSTYFSMGMGFPSTVVSFASDQMSKSAMSFHVYSDRTRYNLSLEGGEAGETATSVQFVGLDASLCFSLLIPESELPEECQGKIWSLVTFGMQKVSAAESVSPVGITDIIRNIRDAISPFSYIAHAFPSNVGALNAGLAQRLKAAGQSAQQAAPVLAGHDPQQTAHSTDAFLKTLTQVFPETTSAPSQVAWSLSAANVPPAQASSAIGAFYLDKITMSDFLRFMAGAYPIPAVTARITELQLAGSKAADAALPIKQSNPQFNALPDQLGVVLRVHFDETSNTPPLMAHALHAAEYTKDEVQSALALLFPTTPNETLVDVVSSEYDTQGGEIRQ